MNLAKYGSLPNVITIGRLLLVPVIVSMIVDGEWANAFGVFVIAGASDAADGCGDGWTMRSRTAGSFSKATRMI